MSALRIPAGIAMLVLAAVWLTSGIARVRDSRWIDETGWPARHKAIAYVLFPDRRWHPKGKALRAMNEWFGRIWALGAGVIGVVVGMGLLTGYIS